jgi:hypothetical protein
VGTDAPVIFYVHDDLGAPLAGVPVSIGVTGPATLSEATVTTNATGYASAILHASTVTGTAAITADYSGTVSSLNVPIISGPPATMTLSVSQMLLAADSYSTSTITAYTNDSYGNPCNDWPVNFTVDGATSPVYTSSDGTATYVLGPYGSSHTCLVTVEAGGLTVDLSVRFLLVCIYTMDYPASVPAGQNVSVTALLLDDITPAAGIDLKFTVYSPNSLATPSTYAGTTGADGKVVFTFQTSTKAGINTVIVSNQSLGGDLKSASIRGTSGSVSKILLAQTPSIVYADGATHMRLRMWARDAGNNPVKYEELAVTRDGIINYSVTTNSNGYAEVDLGASQYVGNVMVDVVALSGASNNTTLSYLAGPPAQTVIKAIPNVIASSDVVEPPGYTDIHTTDIIASVTDEWFHPLPGYTINVSAMNTSEGTITGPASGVTDANGEFYTAYTLGDHCNGTGYVYVQADSGGLVSSFGIMYINTSFLSIETSIAPRNVSVNDNIDVSILLKGVGWNNRPKPVDLMLIMDKSGSMDWCANSVYPADRPKQGVTNRAGTWELIDTYTNSGVNPIQIFLSSPYPKYKGTSGSYYYLRVTDPTGHNFTVPTSSSTQNLGGGVEAHHGSSENYIMFTAAMNGTYKIYGRQIYSAAAGDANYSMMVLTMPLRLGPSSDITSAAKTSAVQLINNMTTQDQVGLVSYNSNDPATLNRYLRLMKSTNKTNLVNSINGLAASGGTEMYLGIRRAIQDFDAHGRTDVKKVAIILSDGYSYHPDLDVIEANNAKAKGITIYTLGMGMCDEETLTMVANTTGGKFYRATSDFDLAKRYQEIMAEVKDVVANQSTMDIVSERSLINGSIVTDAEYVPGSAVVTFTNGTVAMVEPNITYNDTRYTLSWDTGTIRLNQLWSVSYRLRVMHGGRVTPILEDSNVRTVDEDGHVNTLFFVADSIYCTGSSGGTVSRPDPSLQVWLVNPTNGSSIEQLRQLIIWTTAYTGDENYTQVLSIKADEEDEWMDIARGFGGGKTAGQTWSYYWNIERIPTGNYSIRVYASDGSYDAESIVSVYLPYRSGKIVLQ